MDGMLWFGSDMSHGQAVNFNAVEYEEYFHCVDLGVQLKPIIERYAQWSKSGAAPVRIADPPIKPDAEARCAAPKKCDLANVRERKLHERGEEVLVNTDVGPSVVQSSASPFDFFVWQTRGHSTCRISDGPATRLDMGDVGLIKCAFHNYLYTRSDSLAPSQERHSIRISSGTQRRPVDRRQCVYLVATSRVKYV